MKNICLIYDFTADRLVSEWIGFCNKRTWSTDLDATKIELFENEGFRREKLRLEEAKDANSIDRKPKIELDAEMFNDYGVSIDMDDINQINKLNDQKNENQSEIKSEIKLEIKSEIKSEIKTETESDTKSTENQPNQSTIKQSLKPEPIVEQQNGFTNETKLNGQIVKNEIRSTNCVLENQMNESVELGNDNQIQNRFGDALNLIDWINNDRTKFQLIPLDSKLHLTKPFKTAQIKVHETNEILNESIDELYELLLTRTSDEIGTLGDTLFIGRITLDSTNDQKNKVLLLENPRLFQRKLRLDLSKLSTYSLFPGKIVCFDGEIQPETNNLIVKKFFDNHLLLSPFNETSIKINNQNRSIFLMTASGPISPSTSDDLSSLENLLEQVRILQPHYLILLGPFFDCRNDYLLFNCDGEQFFNKIMKMISNSLKDLITEAIIVPSTFDLNNFNIFPAPPFEHTFPKIRFMSNPSFLNLNGIIISICSVDIIRHIMKEQIKK